MRPLALASRSPRRREIVAALGEPVALVESSFVETPPLAGEAPEECALRLAAGKAAHASPHPSGALVIGADTLVVLEGDILGKPRDQEHASWMLRRLRGKTHTVVTGVAVFDADSGACRARAHRTDVLLRDLSEEEIAAYVASGEAMDKAGAYAVQDATLRPALAVSGCYLNAVGLPLCDLVDLLGEFGRPLETGRADGLGRLFALCADCPLAGDREVSGA